VPFRTLPQMRPSWLAAASFALCLVLAGPVLTVSAQSVEGPAEFLVAFGQRANKELNNPALDAVQRENRFRELFREAVDVPTIGRFILGINWRRATEVERSDFLATFEDIAVQRFLPVFTGGSDEYKGTGFEVLDTRPVANLEDQVFVRTRVERSKGPPAEIVWRVRKIGNGYKVLDVAVEGLSMALTLRDEYAAALKRLGSVSELVKALRQKLQQNVYVPKSPTASQ